MELRVSTPLNKRLGVDISPDAKNFGREKKGGYFRRFDIRCTTYARRGKLIGVIAKIACDITEPRSINELIRNLNVKYLCISVPNDFSAFQYEANKTVKRKHWW